MDIGTHYVSPAGVSCEVIAFDPHPTTKTWVLMLFSGLNYSFSRRVSLLDLRAYQAVQ